MEQEQNNGARILNDEDPQGVKKQLANDQIDRVYVMKKTEQRSSYSEAIGKFKHHCDI